MLTEMHHTIREPRITPERSYPIKADLDCLLLDASGVLERGHGQTQAMSRSSVWLESDLALRLGVLVELGITWPVRLDNKVPLRLIIYGRTVSVDGKYAKVEILRHEFRTRGLAFGSHQQRRPALTAERTITASA